MDQVLYPYSVAWTVSDLYNLQHNSSNALSVPNLYTHRSITTSVTQTTNSEGHRYLRSVSLNCRRRFSTEHDCHEKKNDVEPEEKTRPP